MALIHPYRDGHAYKKPAKCGLFAPYQEISGVSRVRGGGRSRVRTGLQLAAKMGKILGKTRIKVAADDTDAESLCGTGVSADSEGEK